MGRQVYSYAEYKVFRAKGGYIIHNTNKPFKRGHTHIADFFTTKYLIYLSRHRIIPRHLSPYLWVSLERISSDKKYQRKIRHIIDEINIRRNTQ